MATGTSQTLFKVFGYGWPPGLPLTLSLTHQGAVPRSQVISADLMGNFDYEINLDHRVFAHGLPPGIYYVTVAAPRAPTATASFIVRRG